MAEEITPQEAKRFLDQDNALLIDVREDDEVSEGMAAPASWFPTSRMDDADPGFKTFLQNLPKNKSIIFYCASGRRSGQVAEYLESQGFQTANMGGFESWVAAGFPTKRP